MIIKIIIIVVVHAVSPILVIRLAFLFLCVQTYFLEIDLRMFFLSFRFTKKRREKKER